MLLGCEHRAVVPQDETWLPGEAPQCWSWKVLRSLTPSLGPLRSVCPQTCRGGSGPHIGKGNGGGGTSGHGGTGRWGLRSWGSSDRDGSEPQPSSRGSLGSRSKPGAKLHGMGGSGGCARRGCVAPSVLPRSGARLAPAFVGRAPAPSSVTLRWEVSAAFRDRNLDMGNMRVILCNVILLKWFLIEFISVSSTINF